MKRRGCAGNPGGLCDDIPHASNVMSQLATAGLSDRTRLVLIAGAPRCGTTAMSRYLGRHAQICLSNPKETHFFLSPTSAADPAASRDRYRRHHFPDLDWSHQVLLDGSISCLYSPDSARRVLAVFPDARFIVMLRNPVDLVHSYHGRLLFYRQETETDLQRAWDLQVDRANGRNIPTFCSNPEILRYREVGSLGRHLEAFFAAVGCERCLLVFYDDFIEDPGTSYRAALAFAGLPDDGRTEFPRKGRPRAYRSSWVQFMLSGAFLMPLLPVGAGSTAFYGRLARWSKPWRKRIRSLSAPKVERELLSPQARANLYLEFKDDIDRLARLTGRNLDSWRVAASSPEEALSQRVPAAGMAR